ncbi:GNAT family N-acetyltransferase [Desulfovibrio oxamicus]|uniref:GNAT family N-acetyltransferase n=2 Tax=Nitratidesulfovibrio oxamicus TaxID=32016 RepID=A0ABS0J091_9BACT|nr:GNAT family N-acetyltransferase [Nitratidesulfovibrio oxamicus]
MGTAMNIREMQRCIEDNLATRLAAQVELLDGGDTVGRTGRAVPGNGQDMPMQPERAIQPEQPARLDRADVRAVYAGVASDTFNKAFGYEGGVPLADTVAAVRSFFGGRGAPYTWWLGPLSGAGDGAGGGEDMPAALAAHGFAVGEVETGMYLPLADADMEGPAPTPGLDIRVVRDAAGVADFAEVLAANWNPPDGEVLRFYRRAAPALCSPGCPATLLAAYLDGQLAAAAEVYRTASGFPAAGGTAHLDVAGVYNVCTLEAFRRKGLGTAVTRAALLHARQAGCRHAVLQASGDGYRVYARLGFRDVGHFVECVPAD